MFQLFRRLVKIAVHRPWQRIQQRPVALEFPLRFVFGRLGRDFAGMIEKVTAGNLQEFIQLVDPVGHLHLPPLQRLELRKLDVEIHDPVQNLQFVFSQIVLRNRDVILADDPPPGASFADPCAACPHPPAHG